MHFVTVSDNGRTLLGFINNGAPYTFRDAIRLLGGWKASAPGTDTGLQEVLDDILLLVSAGETALQAAESVATRFAGALGAGNVKAAPATSLSAPIPRPRKNVFCVGRNYAEHARERGAEPPEHPVFFTKAPTTVVGPGAVVPYPPQTEQFDFEGELAVVIGRKGRDIAKADAHQYVFGYTIVNDLTARDLQARHKQFFKGKSLDGTCPMGPAIVTRDEVEDVASLSVETRVNGRLRQSASTAQMIFDVPTVIARLSEGLTLEPGDVIATGTPAGVGAATGEFLSPGDRVDVSISGLGTLQTLIGPS